MSAMLAPAEAGGTANLFMMFAPLEGWRHVEVTDRHTGVDYAQVLKALSDTHFPKAKKIVLVQDNLNSHKPASLYEAFPAAEARRLVERFEWHDTPKHAGQSHFKTRPAGWTDNPRSSLRA
jgi:DDE superfamily endonuclease